MSCLPFTRKRSECACGCGRYAETQLHTCRNAGDDTHTHTCAHVPCFLLQCSSTAAWGASRWHCTAVCGTGLWAVDPVSVCLACGATAVFFGAFGCLLPHLCYAVLVIFVFHGHFCLRTNGFSSSVIDNTFFSGNFQAEQQWVSAFFLTFGNNARLDSQLCNTQLYGNWQTC